MSNEFAGQAEHSAEYFGESRDFWWSRDYLGLVATRWELARVRTVLDVGCGVGHWSRTLGQILPPEATLIGIDREPRWAQTAAERAQAAGFGGRFSYQVGTGEQIPFPDHSFDLVTCQTVLIHCPDPGAVVREMVRVAKPGGRVAVVEPNNASNTLLDPSVVTGSIDDILALVRLQLLCERGKVAAGEGSISLGELVPKLFVEAGLSRVSVFLNDHAGALIPPYQTPEMRAVVEEMRDGVAREMWAWDKETTLRYFLAGGGAQDEFDAVWALAGVAYRQQFAQIESGTFVAPRGSVNYLVSGLKPDGRAGKLSGTGAAKLLGGV